MTAHRFAPAVNEFPVHRFLTSSLSSKERIDAFTRRRPITRATARSTSEGSRDRGVRNVDL